LWRSEKVTHPQQHYRIVFQRMKRIARFRAECTADSLGFNLLADASLVLKLENRGALIEIRRDAP
jgi:hypothetical protein